MIPQFKWYEFKTRRVSTGWNPPSPEFLPFKEVSEAVTSEIRELKTHSMFRRLLSCQLSFIRGREEKTNTEINPLCTPAVAFNVQPILRHSLYFSLLNTVTDLIWVCCARYIVAEGD